MDDLAIYYFHQGTSSKAYNFLGAHYTKEATTFRVWAPNAMYVTVVGDFNNWDLNSNLMTRINNEGIYEITIDNVKEYDNYQFAITTKNGRLLYKADPYAFHSELRPSKRSKVFDLNSYKFNDSKWLEERFKYNTYSQPLNIYELHMGSWRKYNDGNFFNYRKIAEELVIYLKEMDYTHVEVLPISEYPYDPSWGYQVTGFYSVTSRYGTPNDFKYFVDYLHQNGIGVILDWVPGHFTKDLHGLIEFDGSFLYEPTNIYRREHKSWGTRCFDYSKCEVQSFLVSNAMFWIEEFHIDGLRTDAVSSMLYLDYDRRDGEWVPNEYGTNIALDAIAFIKKVNGTIKGSHPDCLMIAEESTAFEGITKPTTLGGLGYDYKWNMGWMNDSLSFIENDPLFRGDHINKISFQLTYAFKEHYILALSHDEVVHLKRSLLDKMPGSYVEKFGHLRSYFTYFMTHPGKKLSFMGNELGMFNEWNESRELDWNLLSFDAHSKLQLFIKTLNEIYLTNSCLYDDTKCWDSFKWDVVDDKQNCVFVYERKSSNESLIILLNFSNLEYYDYNISTENGLYDTLLCSELKEFGGYLDSYEKEFNVSNNSLMIKLPAHSGIILKRR